jgi:hypothetical protein
MKVLTTKQGKEIIEKIIDVSFEAQTDRYNTYIFRCTVTQFNNLYVALRLKKINPFEVMAW